MKALLLPLLLLTACGVGVAEENPATPQTPQQKAQAQQKAQVQQLTQKSDQLQQQVNQLQNEARNQAQALDQARQSADAANARLDAQEQANAEADSARHGRLDSLPSTFDAMAAAGPLLDAGDNDAAQAISYAQSQVEQLAANARGYGAGHEADFYQRAAEQLQMANDLFAQHNAAYAQAAVGRAMTLLGQARLIASSQLTVR